MCGYDGKKRHISSDIDVIVDGAPCWNVAQTIQCVKNRIGYELRVDSTISWSNDQDNVFEVAAVVSEELIKKAWTWDVVSDS